MPNGHMFKRVNNCALVFKRVADLLFVLVIPDNGREDVKVFHSDDEMVAWYKSIQPTQPVPAMKVCRHCGMHMPAGSIEDDCLYYKSQQQSA